MEIKDLFRKMEENRKNGIGDNFLFKCTSCFKIISTKKTGLYNLGICPNCNKPNLVRIEDRYQKKSFNQKIIHSPIPFEEMFESLEMQFEIDKIWRRKSNKLNFWLIYFLTSSIMIVSLTILIFGLFHQHNLWSRYSFKSWIFWFSLLILVINSHFIFTGIKNKKRIGKKIKPILDRYLEYHLTNRLHFQKKPLNDDKCKGKCPYCLEGKCSIPIFELKINQIKQIPICNIQDYKSCFRFILNSIGKIGDDFKK